MLLREGTKKGSKTPDQQGAPTLPDPIVDELLSCFDDRDPIDAIALAKKDLLSLVNMQLEYLDFQNFEPEELTDMVEDITKWHEQVSAQLDEWYIRETGETPPEFDLATNVD